ncbi:FK506-binding protein 2 [Hibiscus syriacus]|uniref:peptidylprolyl isomerase n=1 Tax=Hibiscus syriacus TaxID=106335 RepID=A0A6A2Z2A3_HIBSY|nr:FK506-binding protein 2 [Hibiscus syriacus]
MTAVTVVVSSKRDDKVKIRAFKELAVDCMLPMTSFVHIYCHPFLKGKLTDGAVFNSSFERGDPIGFELGSGRVIKGWDQGLLGMYVGENRKLKIPAKLGYGEHG